MNWYKKAQKIPTMKNIIWAIDKLIAENYDFSVEELQQASQGSPKQQYSLPKAAQTRTRPRRSIAPKIKNINRLPNNIPPLDYEVLELLNRGTNTRDIAKQLDFETKDIAAILKKYYPSKRSIDDYLKQEHEQNILNTTEDLSQEMRKDFNIEKIGAKEIASVLDLDPKFVYKIVRENQIDLAALIRERRDRIAANIREIVNDLPFNFTIKNVMNEFQNRYNFKLKLRSAHSAVILGNMGEKRQNDPNSIYKAFTTYVNNNLTEGRARIRQDPEKLSTFIDNFFNQYGQNFGFVTPMQQKKLKEMWFTKLQMRANTENLEKRIYSPVDFSENNPAIFLHDREQPNELV